MRTNVRWAYSFAAFLVGCNTLEEPTPCGDECKERRLRRIVPTDERAAIVQSVRPPPISGGTLLVTADSIVVSDPDRDHVSIVDLGGYSVRASLALNGGDEPGRLAEGKDGSVHVALRGAGSVLAIDTKLGTIVSRTPVCGEPRGLAFDPATSRLLVACAEGVLAELEGTSVVKRTALGPDLRDVVVQGEHVYVSRFRSATVLKLDAARKVVSTSRLPSVLLNVPSLFPSSSPENRPATTALFEPAVAWRMIPASDGVTVLHQRATGALVRVDEETRDDQAGSPYGDGTGCESIVGSAVSRIDGAGSMTTSDGIASTVLPVDIAVSPDGQRIAIATAGPPDLGAPQQRVVVEPSVENVGGETAPSAPVHFGGITLLNPSATSRVVEGDVPLVGCAFPSQPTIVSVPTIAVAFDANGRLYAQSREPSALYVFDGPSTFQPRLLALQPESFSRADTGHDIFHRDGGAGIACASCHPEGGEDGRVWNFDVSGHRRTQALDIGLAGTAPFHWDGDLQDMSSLMSEVFVGRMNGVFESAPRIDALASYIFSFKAPKPTRAADDAAALRGRQVFESADVGCASCHGGRAFTDNRTMDVGKGKALQVPSLIGISRRAPYMHDGCAPTLADRFQPDCGGTSHGDVSQIGPEAIADLVAYLESL